MSVPEGTEVAHLFIATPSNPSPDLLDRWAGAIGHERVLRAEELRPADPPRTLHVGGGGAPSAFGAALVGRLLEALEIRAPDEELGVEAEAAHLTDPVIEAWLRDGVTRVGVRPAPGPVLAAASSRLNAHGVREWDVELEFGAFGEGARGAAERVHELLESRPPQVSLCEADDVEADPERAADMYLALGDALVEAGYRPVDVVSFDRDGRGSAHFRAVWQGEPYIGLGPGAHSFDGDARRWNSSSEDAYFLKVRRGIDPVAGREHLGAEARDLERVWSGLRRAEGIAVSDLGSEGREIRARWVRRGLAHSDPHRLRLTRRGWLLLDGLAVELASAVQVDAGSAGRRSSEAT